MIECIFTIDYEIYGNGEGALRTLVYEPTERLRELFAARNATFVAFVEAAELSKIESQGEDEAIPLVRAQLKSLYREGVEIGLHLHPQWCNASYEKGRWVLDEAEYNLCRLPRGRIKEILTSSVTYLRDVLGDPGFTPVSFRAGNWLLQPTHPAAEVLVEIGIMVDSSVFKGGVQRARGLDYRPALKNGYYWPFALDVNLPAADGALLELPTHTEMVPFWQMLTRKRVGLEQKGAASSKRTASPMTRIRDYLRLRYPKKLDFCRMTLDEFASMVERERALDRLHPEVYRPLVAIGHTKDLVDLKMVDSCLAYLASNGIPITTLEQAQLKCRFASAGALVAGEAL